MGVGEVLDVVVFGAEGGVEEVVVGGGAGVGFGVGEVYAAVTTTTITVLAVFWFGLRCRGGSSGWCAERFEGVEEHVYFQGGEGDGVPAPGVGLSGFHQVPDCGVVREDEEVEKRGGAGVVAIVVVRSAVQQDFGQFGEVGAGLEPWTCTPLGERGLRNGGRGVGHERPSVNKDALGGGS